MSLSEHTTTLISKTANVATYGGSGGAVYFGLTANELGVFCGIVIGVAGFIVNWYYKRAHFKLAQERKLTGYVDE